MANIIAYGLLFCSVLLTLVVHGQNLSASGSLPYPRRNSSGTDQHTDNANQASTETDDVSTLASYSRYTTSVDSFTRRFRGRACQPPGTGITGGEIKLAQNYMSSLPPIMMVCQRTDNPFSLYHINRALRRRVIPQSMPQSAYAPAKCVRAGDQQTSTATNTSIPMTIQGLLATKFGPDYQFTLEDFISLLSHDDGRNVTEEDIFEETESEQGKLMITGGGMMAVSDECSPRNMSVRLEFEETEENVVYYPECTKVERCGGCTPTPYLSCEPRYKERIVLHVLKAIYPYPGAPSMHWVGYQSVTVERHLTCQAVCTLEEGDCGPLKEFKQYQCKCECRSFKFCNRNQKWDDDVCDCRCRNEGPCCSEDEDDERTCTMYFDHDHCECTLKMAVGAAVNATQAEIEAWLASRRQNTETSSTAPTTTTTTTTATTPTTSPDQCAALTCPPGFLKLRSRRGGRCFCQYPRRHRG